MFSWWSWLFLDIFCTICHNARDCGISLINSSVSVLVRLPRHVQLLCYSYLRFLICLTTHAYVLASEFLLWYSTPYVFSLLPEPWEAVVCGIHFLPFLTLSTSVVLFESQNTRKVVVFFIKKQQLFIMYFFFLLGHMMGTFTSGSMQCSTYFSGFFFFFFCFVFLCL